MIIEDNYASWLNHKWLLQHVKNVEVLKPTDLTDPDYEKRIRIWQGALAIPHKLRDSIRLQNQQKSLDILRQLQSSRNVSK